jgi:type IV fimbrial biogenesis protein FimT
MLKQHLKGVTLVELAVVVAIMALLGMLAAPSLSRMVANSQVRAISESVQNGLRLAQADATRRYRQTVFFRTSTEACNNTVQAGAGGFWIVKTIPMLINETAEVVQCGTIGEIGGKADLDGPMALCFSSDGRLVAQANPNVGSGVTCDVPASGAASFDVKSTRADRPLRIRVTSAGAVRLCDPAKTLSTATPDGCPP